MSELNRLRMELRTEVELIAIRQGDHAKVVDQLSERIEEHGVELLQNSHKIAQQSENIAEQGQKIAEHGRQIAAQGQQIAAQGQQIAAQGQQIAAQGQQIAASMKSTGRLGREFAENSRWIQGRLRLLNERFEAVLGAVEEDNLCDRARLNELTAQQDDLQVRVTRLEQDRNSAA